MDRSTNFFDPNLLGVIIIVMSNMVFLAQVVLLLTLQFIGSRDMSETQVKRLKKFCPCLRNYLQIVNNKIGKQRVVPTAHAATMPAKDTSARANHAWLFQAKE